MLCYNIFEVKKKLNKNEKRNQRRKYYEKNNQLRKK